MLSVLVVCGNCLLFFTKQESLMYKHCATKNLVAVIIKVPVVTRFHRSTFRGFFLTGNVKKMRVNRAFPLYINFEVLVIQESIKCSIVLPIYQPKENGLKGAPAVVGKPDVVSLIRGMEQGYLVTNWLVSFSFFVGLSGASNGFLLQEVYKLEYWYIS